MKNIACKNKILTTPVEKNKKLWRLMHLHKNISIIFYLTLKNTNNKKYQNVFNSIYKFKVCS